MSFINCIPAGFEKQNANEFHIAGIIKTSGIVNPFLSKHKKRNYNNLKKLFEEQNGVCWICNRQMRMRLIDKAPRRWDATIDHLEPRSGKPRPTKAAHAGCNSVRQHDAIFCQRVVSYVKGAHKLFDKSDWVKNVFGK